MKISFNPWFNGFQIQSRSRPAISAAAHRVSILGLMDFKFKGSALSACWNDAVRFNPWFNGFQIQSLPQRTSQTCLFGVSILGLMDFKFKETDLQA